MSNEIYTGTVIQGKRKKLSFKSKKFIDVPEEDWVKVPNMHEAIVSIEDYERAKRIIESTKGSRVVENDYLFKGLLRCYDCKGYIGIRSPDKMVIFMEDAKGMEDMENLMYVLRIILIIKFLKNKC